jgi:hypothetical protein
MKTKPDALSKFDEFMRALVAVPKTAADKEMRRAIAEKKKKSAQKRARITRRVI